MIELILSFSRWVGTTSQAKARQRERPDAPLSSRPSLGGLRVLNRNIHPTLNQLFYTHTPHS